MTIEIRCNGCGKSPEEVGCYDAYLDPGETASEYVQKEDGTYNPENGHFWCDGCYVDAGQPLGKAP